MPLTSPVLVADKQSNGEASAIIPPRPPSALITRRLHPMLWST